MTLSRLPRRLLLGGVLLVAPLLAATTLADEPRPRLDVQAEARIEVVPDQATLSARLWERTPPIAQRDENGGDPDALREARDRLETRATKLIQALEAAGLERDAISAGSLNVQPEHIAAPQGGDAEREMLVRTRLERPFRIQVDDLERLPVLLDALTEAGVDTLDGVTYDLADRDAATDEAMVKALEKARHKAELMADTLGVSLGEVIAIGENLAPVFQPRMMAMSDAAMESAQRTEYRPGTLDIEAGVSVSWEIKQP